MVGSDDEPKVGAMTALRWGSPLTIADLDAMPEDGHRYELVDGTLLVTPAPNTRHQCCVARLVAALVAAADPDLMVLPAPYDWVAGPATLFQPDLLVARRADLGPKRLERPPLLVIEVLSPSTRRIDLATKRMAYADFGVAGYWLVDPDVPSLTVLSLEAGQYVQASSVVGDEAWQSPAPIQATVVPARLVD
jgi:Uma2 family endonuclease